MLLLALALVLALPCDFGSDGFIIVGVSSFRCQPPPPPCPALIVAFSFFFIQDYFVESTRGFKHFVAKVTIADNLLYACTAQAKEKDYPEVEAQLKRIVESFRVPA